ncbi:sigma factor [Paenibacillus sp. OK003]|uniref:sigma factor n=1 Tax=Paenibacillus sp. OK003 TaxID=1884380 RepID=UPI0008C6228A|nr:sigma factor [Paenibacillus sp. OK003]SEL42973.1 Sigma-70 region 2 [Paenibacillus sp. OK003]
MQMEAAELEEVQRAIQGDDSALAELLQRHYAFVYKYLVKVTMDPNVAEETVQDTMFNVWKIFIDTMARLPFRHGC